MLTDIGAKAWESWGLAGLKSPDESRISPRASARVLSFSFAVVNRQT